MTAKIIDTHVTGYQRTNHGSSSNCKGGVNFNEVSIQHTHMYLPIASEFFLLKQIKTFLFYTVNIIIFIISAIILILTFLLILLINAKKCLLDVPCE